MTHKHHALIFSFMMFFMLLFISGCDTFIDNQYLDVSQITATGTQGPQDFIGNIDLSDWSPSNYNAIVMGNSFWIQKPSVSDTLFFRGRLSGDSANQSLKIYNRGNTNLSVKLQLDYPFFATHDSVEIQPLMTELVNLYFLLPDTTNTVYNGMVTLRFSTLDSMIFKLNGSRARQDTGSVGSMLPTDFSLSPAYPNPTDGEISFGFSVPQRIDAVLNVVNKENEVVTTIAQGNYVAGTYKLSWNANLGNGNYRIIFHAGNFTSKGDIQILR